MNETRYEICVSNPSGGFAPTQPILYSFLNIKDALDKYNELSRDGERIIYFKEAKNIPVTWDIEQKAFVVE